ETAHCPARRIVRVDAGALDERILDRVRAARKGRRVRRDGGGARGVGAAVQQDLRADIDELAVAVRPVLHPDLRGVAVDVAEEGLVLDAELVDAGDADLRLRVRIAVADHDRADDVRTIVVAEAVARGRAALVDRFSLGRMLRVDDGLERLVSDLDLFRRSTR